VRGTGVCFVDRGGCDQVPDRVQKEGNTTHERPLVAYDVLPYIGDKGRATRGDIAPRLDLNETLVVGPVTSSSPTVTMSYSTSPNPPRTEVYSGDTDHWKTGRPASGARRACWG